MTNFICEVIGKRYVLQLVCPNDKIEQTSKNGGFPVAISTTVQPTLQISA